MCGITGAFGPGAADRDLVGRMSGAIRHRGPDHAGEYFADGVALAVNRLAISDLAGGNQPMYSAYGAVALIYNGEIYTFRELRAQLEPDFRFQTRSDTEVILNRYLVWEMDVFRRLNGIF